MTDTTVVIKAKTGCSDTGITPELATRLATKKKTKLLAIVEFESDEVHAKVDGSKRKLDLNIVEIEPIVEPDALEGRTEETIRRIKAALAANRVRAQQDAAGQLPLGDQPTGPSLSDLAGELESLVETNDLDEPTGIYDPAKAPHDDLSQQHPDDDVDDSAPSGKDPAFSGR